MSKVGQFMHRSSNLLKHYCIKHLKRALAPFLFLLSCSFCCYFNDPFIVKLLFGHMSRTLSHRSCCTGSPELDHYLEIKVYNLVFQPQFCQQSLKLKK